MATPEEILPPNSIIYSNQIQQKDGFNVSINLLGNLAADAQYYTTFFIVRHPCEILYIQEAHKVAGNDAGAVTLNIEKLTGTTAPGSGTNILTTAISLKATANTVYAKSHSDMVSAGRLLSTGDRLALVLTGTPTNVNSVSINIYLKYSGRGDYR